MEDFIVGSFDVPLSSRTRDSNSAMRFRSRVLSSRDGSSLRTKKKKNQHWTRQSTEEANSPEGGIIDLINT